MADDLIEQFRAGLADFYMSGPWTVVSDHPALGIACGGYRVVQTANQNNHRRFGASERWYGIESYGAANHIARCSPDNIRALLDALSSKDKALEEMRAELERLRALLDSIIARDDRNGSLPEWYRHEIDANYARPNPPSEGDGK